MDIENASILMSQPRGYLKICFIFRGHRSKGLPNVLKPMYQKEKLRCKSTYHTVQVLQRTILSLTHHVLGNTQS